MDAAVAAGVTVFLFVRTVMTIKIGWRDEGESWVERFIWIFGTLIWIFGGGYVAEGLSKVLHSLNVM